MRVFICDQNLISYTGHYFGYDKIVKEAFLARQISTNIIAHRTAETYVVEQLGALPLFSHHGEAQAFSFLPTSCLMHYWSTRGIVADTVRDLHRLHHECTLQEQDILFFPNIVPTQIRSLRLFLNALPRGKRPKIVLFLRYSPSPNPYYPFSGSAKVYKDEIRALNNSSAGERVVWITDSELLSLEYFALAKISPHCVPIPHVFTNFEKPKTLPIRITFLGSARGKKGFKFLPSLVLRTKDLIDQHIIEYELQSTLLSINDEEAYPALEVLKKLPVTCTGAHSLSSDEYFALLERSCVIIIPYEIEYYYAQTSGVLAEAIGAGRPVIVPRGTWAHSQVEGYDNYLDFFPGNVEELVQAVRELPRRYNSLLEGAQKLKNKWAIVHSPSAFVDALISKI